MKIEEITFLDEYKKLCIKHKMQILGFDDGAFISHLTDDEYELEALIFEGNTGIHFADKNELKNSIADVKVFRSSTQAYKEDTTHPGITLTSNK
jgi:hypothetical protein